MAIFDTNLDYTQLIQFTNGTLQLASFVQIRNALIQRMKDIYGNDIDVSPASADGQYINSIALLINNTFQTIKKANDSIDPAAATGQYLDTICSYNNIFRIEASKSIAQLYIYNSTGSPVSVNYLTFIDKNNTLWIWDNGGKNITIPVPTEDQPAYVLDNVLCEEIGNISAPGTNAFYHYNNETGEWSKVTGENPQPLNQTWDRIDLYTDVDKQGTIYQCVNNNGLYVYQYKDAIVGNITETDEALRSRRYLSLGNASVTVLEGLKGNLLDLEGIKDVYIFNNQASLDGDSGGIVLTKENGFEPIADDTSLLGHSIYIAIRYKEGITLENESVGKIIYNKLTPGISTSPITVDTTNGIQGSLEIVRTENFSDYIYWKICTSIKPQIVIEFITNPKLYDYPTQYEESGTIDSHIASNAIEKQIVEKLQEFINEVKINDYLAIPNLLTVMQQADIQKLGMPTFFTQTGTIGEDEVYTYPANLAYFKYDKSDYKFGYEVDQQTNLPTGPATLIIG